MRAICLCLLLLTTVTASAAEHAGDAARQKALHGIWERYVPKLAPRTVSTFIPPGRCVGDSPELRVFAAESQWAWRHISYEMYFSSSVELARGIYGLALDTGDVSRDMPLERFEKAVQGFHYDVDQVCRWANKLLRGSIPASSAEERRLLDWLLMDGALNILNGAVVPSGAVRHILGAASGKRRTFILNLVHERVHILWDEDTAFRRGSMLLWQSLSPQEKEAVFASLPGYARDREEQLIEEWAVRRAEHLPLEERRKLVGI